MSTRHPAVFLMLFGAFALALAVPAAAQKGQEPGETRCPGTSTATSSLWTMANNTSCNNNFRLYCFEQ